jgi:hypothetical protein
MIRSKHKRRASFNAGIEIRKRLNIGAGVDGFQPCGFAVEDRCPAEGYCVVCCILFVEVGVEEVVEERICSGEGGEVGA